MREDCNMEDDNDDCTNGFYKKMGSQEEADMLVKTHLGLNGLNTGGN